MRLDVEFNKMIKKIKIEKSANEVVAINVSNNDAKEKVPHQVNDQQNPSSSSTTGNPSQSIDVTDGQNNRNTNVIWCSPLKFLKSTFCRQQ